VGRFYDGLRAARWRAEGSWGYLPGAGAAAP
jgi:hypothetical protein